MKRKTAVFTGVMLALMLSMTSCTPMSFLQKTFEVTFDPNGGELVSGELEQKVKDGDDAEEPVVKRDGFVFAGWDQETDDISEDMVIKANWDEIYDITFDVNGGELVSGQDKQEVRAGEMPSAPEVEMEYAELEGWEPEIKAADSDTTYVAQWRWRELSSKEIYELISPAVPVIHVQLSDGNEALGSGFFIDDSGTLVTNYHVIDTAVSGHVTFPDGEEYDILGVKDYDEKKDLAILDIDCMDNPYLWISDKDVETGENVYTLGAPLGLDDTFSSGIVSKASREIEEVRYIQTTAPISQGNSGGPLVDVYGEVVGVNCMTSREGQNLNFAISVKELDDLEKEGEAARTLAELNEEVHPPAKETTSDSVVYELSDKIEVETNNSMLTADAMKNDETFGAAVSDNQDVDFYYLDIDQDGTITPFVIPEDAEDVEHLYCGILEISDSDFEVVAVLERYDLDDSVVLATVAEVEKDKVYFLCVTSDEDYQFEDPIYYLTYFVF